MRNVSLVALFVLTLPLAAQELQESLVLEPHASPDCTLGVRYDVTINHDIAFTGATGQQGVAMKFALPAGTTGIDQVCACFTHETGGATSTSFDVLVYDDNGSGGGPGTLLKTVTSSVTGIPQFGSVKFANVNLASSGLVLPDTSVIVAIRWPQGQKIFHCDDLTGPAAAATYLSANGTIWAPTASFGVTAPRAAGIRLDPITSPSSACVPSTTAMCLSGGRFKVEATWATGSNSGNATVVKLTDDSGYLWFFSSTNIEAIVKVLNACGINGYWVYAGGLTNVNVVLKVTDTKTGAVKTYTNPLGAPFQPIQDVNAFNSPGTCP